MRDETINRYFLEHAIHPFNPQWEGYFTNSGCTAQGCCLGHAPAMLQEPRARSGFLQAQMLSSIPWAAAASAIRAKISRLASSGNVWTDDPLARMLI